MVVQAIAATKRRSLADMARTLTQLRIQMRDLGLTVSVWDPSGKIVGRFMPCCELCQTIHDLGGPCLEACGSAASTVMRDGRPACSRSPIGCCVLGTPIVERRRTLGAVVACYLPREALGDEELARLCGAVGMDRQSATTMAKTAARHSADEADDFLRVLTWLLAKEQAVITTQSELGGLSANLANTYEELSLLYAISGSMNINRQSHEFLAKVCSEILDVMNISAVCGIMYARGQAGQEIVAAGQMHLDEQRLEQLLVGYLQPALADSQGPVIENSFAGQEGEGAPIRNLLAVPLATEDQVIGAMVAMNKRSGDFDSTDLKLFTSIAAQVAIFLEYSRLYADMKDLLMGVLHALTSSIDAKDPYTCGHSQRVAAISKRLAEAAGLPPERAQRVYLAGLLHDVGKIGMPESILCKAGALTEEEQGLVKDHPMVAAKILSGIRQLDDVITWIQAHHEHVDGSGYPRGLVGDQIPLEARIIHLADCFDAMTSNRVYRDALSLDSAVEEIRRVSGTQVDAALADRLLSMDLAALLAEAEGQPTEQPAAQAAQAGPGETAPTAPDGSDT